MKKRGFTLAEVLIALGIIGVVAAITMPTFTASTQNAKIGPALATAVNNFEMANQALLQEYDARSLTEVASTWKGSAGGATFIAVNDVKLFSDNKNDVAHYGIALSDFLKASVEKPATTTVYQASADSSGATPYVFKTKNGASYYVQPAKKDSRIAKNAGVGSAAHKRYIGQVDIDINGDGKPNVIGQDVFVFGLFADGSLRPKGGAQNWNNTDNIRWSNKKGCPADAEPVDASYCAGHIFENGLKVRYQ